jgi:hypothetical protein
MMVLLEPHVAMFLSCEVSHTMALTPQVGPLFNVFVSKSLLSLVNVRGSDRPINPQKVGYFLEFQLRALIY